MQENYRLVIRQLGGDIEYVIEPNGELFEEEDRGDIVVLDEGQIRVLRRILDNPNLFGFLRVRTRVSSSTAKS